jgi:translation initiation factor 2 alpha subunit (eIF-2alpha)
MDNSKGMEIEEGDVVLCTVIDVGKTNTSVKIDDKMDGIIPTSEIAAGRIRNLRDYVVPQKKIVCKVLRINPSGSIVLSLRRVSLKENKEVLESYEREKTSKNILKVILKDSAEELCKNIVSRENKKVYEFLHEAIESPGILEAYIGKENSDKILKILKEKYEKEKEKEIKRLVSLRTENPSGINDIKKVMSECKDCTVSYIGGGKYEIKIKAKDFKKANTKMNEEISEIEKMSKKLYIEFNENVKLK